MEVRAGPRHPEEDMSRRIVRFAAALTLAASLAVPAHAAGSGRSGTSLFDLAWSWLTAWADKGFTIDPDGATADDDKGYGIDPDGLTMQGTDPRAAADDSDRGFTIDPEG
jgi:hypothetical protein